jgi:tRNA A37 methylthiotransferase MiaB
VLERMRRGYTVDYKRIVSDLRAAMRGSLSTDI